MDHPSYVDDLLVACVCERTSEWQFTARLLVEAVHAEMATAGFQVNYGKGKSGLLVVPLGKGKPIAKREIAQCNGFLQVSPHMRVELVSTCKHLGSMIDVSGSMRPELTHRANTQSGVLGCLKRAVFKGSDVAVKCKTKYVGAFCFSRLLFHAGTWCPLNSTCQRMLETSYLAPLHAIVGHLTTPFGIRRKPQHEVLLRTERLPVSVVVTLRRLRYLPKLLRKGPVFMLHALDSLVQVKRSWAAQLRKDME